MKQMETNQMTPEPEKWIEGEIRIRQIGKTRVYLLPEMGSYEIPLTLIEQLQSEAFDKGAKHGIDVHHEIMLKKLKKEIEEARADERKKTFSLIKNNSSLFAGHGSRSYIIPVDKFEKLEQTVESDTEKRT